MIAEEGVDMAVECGNNLTEVHSQAKARATKRRDLRRSDVVNQSKTRSRKTRQSVDVEREMILHVIKTLSTLRFVEEWPFIPERCQETVGGWLEYD